MPLIFPNAALQRTLRSSSVAMLLTKPVDPSLFAASSAKASAVITAARLLAGSSQPSVSRTRDVRIAKIKRASAASIKRTLDSRAMRTPKQIIDAFLLRVKGSRRGVAALPTPAQLIVRSDDAQVAAFLKRLRGSLGVDPAMTGILVARIPLRAGPITSYSVSFPIDHGTVRTELLNVAWALRQSGAFHSVAVSGLRGTLFATTAAIRAERSFAWHLDLTRVSRADAIAPASGGRGGGAGITIAHIDTGWAQHTQYNGARIDVARSHNVITGDTGSDSAKHSIRNRDADSPNITHGTATGSLIIGGPRDDGKELTSTVSDATLAFGTDSNGKRLYNDKKVRDNSGHLTGIAPEATVLPIKFISDTALLEIQEQGVQGVGVFRLFDNDLIRAIRYAIDSSVDVISLSVGGLLHDEVRSIIDEAVEDHNIIICAAVGQTYMANFVSGMADALDLAGLGGGDSVALPAAYSNVVAVAGCGPSGAPWSESHRGPNVDITAPADAVWIADYQPKDERSGTATRRETLECASGTSFAAPIVAAAAARWLAHHGRPALLRRYGGAGVRLAWVFRQLIQQTARPIGSWDDGLYGPGVIDIEALLTAPLPAAADVEPPPAMINGVVSAVSGGLVAAGDVVLEFFDWTSAKADNARRTAAVLWLAGQEAADRAVADLGRAWAQLDAAAQGAVSDLRREADHAKQEIESGIKEILAQGAAAADEAGDQVEELIDDAGKAVEEYSDNVGEAASDVGKAVADFFGFT